MKEPTARSKINKLLETAGWRFFPDAHGPANIQLESNAKVTAQALDDLGENFEKTTPGFIDFLLLNGKGFSPPATQQAIVVEIEAEQALVAANRELIARFEQKIQATLARVWGES